MCAHSSTTWRINLIFTQELVNKCRNTPAKLFCSKPFRLKVTPFWLGGELLFLCVLIESTTQQTALYSVKSPNLHYSILVLDCLKRVSDTLWICVFAFKRTRWTVCSKAKKKIVMLPSPDQNLKIGSVGRFFKYFILLIFFLRTVRELSFSIFFF